MSIYELNKNPIFFENKYVQDVYSKISEHFDKTRYHSWPKIVEFISGLNRNYIRIEKNTKY